MSIAGRISFRTLSYASQVWAEVGEFGPIRRCDKLFGYVSRQLPLTALCLLISVPAFVLCPQSAHEVAVPAFLVTT